MSGNPASQHEKPTGLLAGLLTQYLCDRLNLSATSANIWLMPAVQMKQISPIRTCQQTQNHQLKNESLPSCCDKRYGNEADVRSYISSARWKNRGNCYGKDNSSYIPVIQKRSRNPSKPNHFLRLDTLWKRLKAQPWQQLKLRSYLCRLSAQWSNCLESYWGSECESIGRVQVINRLNFFRNVEACTRQNRKPICEIFAYQGGGFQQLLNCIWWKNPQQWHGNLNIKAGRRRTGAGTRTHAGLKGQDPSDYLLWSRRINTQQFHRNIPRGLTKFKHPQHILWKMNQKPYHDRFYQRPGLLNPFLDPELKFIGAVLQNKTVNVFQSEQLHSDNGERE